MASAKLVDGVTQFCRFFYAERSRLNCGNEAIIGIFYCEVIPPSIYCRAEM